MANAWSLMKDLRHDPMILRENLGSVKIEAAVVSGVTDHNGEFVLVVEPEHNSRASATTDSSTTAPARDRSPSR